MIQLKKILTNKLEPKTKTNIQRRYEALVRGVLFEEERNSEYFHRAVNNGWTKSRLEVLCYLNSFYQVVLGPVASVSDMGTDSSMLREHPIAFGKTLKLTASDAMAARECYEGFQMIIAELGIDYWCLQANQASDLIYRLAGGKEGSE